MEAQSSNNSNTLSKTQSHSAGDDETDGVSATVVVGDENSATVVVDSPKSQTKYYNIFTQESIKNPSSRGSHASSSKTK